MTYKVLSLKWRPQSFEEIVGQSHVSKTLVNSIIFNRVGQGYIFTGPRGVGKTTTARILAMALNSGEKPSDSYNPNSTTALEIAGGRSLDVLEIDGASNRGIEEIRNLREQIKFAPMESKFKIIIIDEIHMLTNQAFNALLRTLEEPPAHAKFIFATTDIHKVPATIISRCQRFDFNQISINDISNRLNFISKKENFKISHESLYLIAKKADGSMRDALSLLEQVISFCGDDFSKKNISEALGIISNDLFFSFTDAVADKDYENMIQTLNLFSKTGVSPSEIIVGIKNHLKNLIYAGISNGKLISDLNIEDKKRYVEESRRWDRLDIFLINQVLVDASVSIKNSNMPFLLLEMTFLKLLEMENSIDLQKLISKIENENNASTNPYPKGSNKIKNVSSNMHMNTIVNPEKKVSPSRIYKENKELVKMKTKQSDKSCIAPESNSGLTLTYAKENWEKILKKFQRDRPSISAMLEDYYPVDFDQNIFFIQSTTGAVFNEKIIKKGKQLLEQHFESIFKIKVRVKIKSEKNIINKKTSLNTKLKVDKKVNDEEIFNKVVDIFDGEILR